MQVCAGKENILEHHELVKETKNWNDVYRNACWKKDIIYKGQKKIWTTYCMLTIVFSCTEV